jgi:basic membrane lipoprotein Med (substrate-binding protein (PBP1-ABC) superfamily)
MILNGMDSGALKLAPFYGAVPPEVEKEVQQAIQDIISGKIKVPRT